MKKYGKVLTALLLCVALLLPCFSGMGVFAAEKSETAEGIVAYHGGVENATGLLKGTGKKINRIVRGSAGKTATRRANVLPCAYSLKDEYLTTSVKKQELGNCWAFSALSALESATLSSVAGINPDFSVENLTAAINGIAGQDYHKKAPFGYEMADAEEKDNMTCNEVTLIVGDKKTVIGSVWQDRKNNVYFQKAGESELRAVMSRVAYAGVDIVYYAGALWLNITDLQKGNGEKIRLCDFTSNRIFVKNNTVYFENDDGTLLVYGTVQRKNSGIYFVDIAEENEVAIASAYYNCAETELVYGVYTYIYFYMNGASDNKLAIVAGNIQYVNGNNGSTYPFAVVTLADWQGPANNTEANKTATGVNDTGIVLDSALCLEDETAIKEWLMQNGGVTAGIYINELCLGENGSYYYPEEADANHGIQIVGWDDAYAAEHFVITPPEDGAWLIKNSWGTDVGCEGYNWVSYCDCTLTDAMGYTVKERDTYQYNYNYFSCCSSSQKELKNNSTLAQVQSFEQAQTLCAVGIYSPANTVTARIRIYPFAQNGNVLVASGTQPLCDYTAPTSFCGYQTVTLPKENRVRAAAGDKLLVTVTLTDKENNPLSVPTEGGKGDAEPGYFTCHSGENYYTETATLENAPWTDNATSEIGNFYLSVLTENTEPFFTATFVVPDRTKTARVTATENYTVTPLTEKKAGYAFMGWATDEGTQTAEYSPTQPITLVEDTIYYAVYQKYDTVLALGGDDLSKTARYQSGKTVTVSVSNPVEGARLVWYADDVPVAESRDSFDYTNYKGTHDLQVKYMLEDLVIAKTQPQSFCVKASFFQRLLAFFKLLFSLL